VPSSSTIVAPAAAPSAEDDVSPDENEDEERGRGASVASTSGCFRLPPCLPCSGGGGGVSISSTATTDAAAAADDDEEDDEDEDEDEDEGAAFSCNGVEDGDTAVAVCPASSSVSTFPWAASFIVGCSRTVSVAAEAPAAPSTEVDEDDDEDEDGDGDAGNSRGSDGACTSVFSAAFAPATAAAAIWARGSQNCSMQWMANAWMACVLFFVSVLKVTGFVRKICKIFNERVPASFSTYDRSSSASSLPNVRWTVAYSSSSVVTRASMSDSDGNVARRSGIIWRASRL